MKLKTTQLKELEDVSKEATRRQHKICDILCMISYDTVVKLEFERCNVRHAVLSN